MIKIIKICALTALFALPVNAQYIQVFAGASDFENPEVGYSAEIVGGYQYNEWLSAEASLGAVRHPYADPTPTFGLGARVQTNTRLNGYVGLGALHNTSLTAYAKAGLEYRVIENLRIGLEARNEGFLGATLTIGF